MRGCEVAMLVLQGEEGFALVRRNSEHRLRTIPIHEDGRECEPNERNAKKPSRCGQLMKSSDQAAVGVDR